ncbi:dihydrofolate reductase family protein [Fodinicola feengrottensis]|uniref:Dihydrofolate reductase family protein n=1 Tax=Fodinicola feengrottensis TaxID=435914 RepID=A0ABP4TUS8_9ACTN|nr:dihydrofolate reductase family protein [Fodinicola feengrottensis]
MRKVIEYVLVSADGVFEDPVGMGVGEYQDEAYLRDGLGLLNACDAMLFGRRTYQAFAGLYGGGGAHKPMWADRLTAIPKYVFSSSLVTAGWGNPTIIGGDAVAEVARLKQQEGGNLLLMGHGLLGETLLREWLIDVIDLAIYPFMAGSGKQLFREGQDAKLRLAAVKTFSKIVKLTYETDVRTLDRRA